MKLKKKNWIAIISVCAVVCGGCIFASVKNGVSTDDINKASEELANDVLGGTVPDIDVKWEELQKALEAVESAVETTTTVETTIATTVDGDVTTIPNETIVETPDDDTNNENNNANQNNGSNGNNGNVGSNNSSGNNKKSNNNGNSGGSRNSSTPTKSSSDATTYSLEEEWQEGVLYEATVVKVNNANEITLEVVGTDKQAKFKYISLLLPEDTILKNVLEYIPENEIEDIDGIRQMILDDDSIKDENKQNIRVYDIVRYKLKEGDTVYIEFDESRFPKLPSDKDYYAYIWFYANEQDKTNDKLTRFQDWALSNGYAQIMADPLNKKYLDYFTELEQNANDTFTGLWNGYFKEETAKEINLESEDTK
jgi:endonuclease YncB( thermonuclease family)